MALLRTDWLHAAGVFRGLQSGGVPIINQGFESLTRNGAGDYTLRCNESIADEEAQCSAWAGPNELMICGALITAPGVLRVLCYDLTGAPTDPITLNLEIKQLQTGPAGDGVLPAPPAPPVPSASQTLQAYWDQPSVSPMVGALSASAMMPPYPQSKGVVGWWVWWATPPDESVLCRLYRYRADPFFSYAQIADDFLILPDSDWATIHDLSGLLYPDAIDFQAAKNDVLALSVLVSGAPTLRALTQRIAFGIGP